MHVERQIKRLPQLHVGKRPLVFVKQIGDQRSPSLRLEQGQIRGAAQGIDIVLRQLEDEVIFPGHRPGEAG
ncbi:hypothetical protein D3C87_2099480 [compost metagenome]